jgi:hypothetical protein
LAIVLTAFVATPALAGFRVSQEVSENGAKQAAQIWEIDGRKFRLTLQNGAFETVYVFNGRLLYICTNFREEQLAVLEKAGLPKDQVMPLLNKKGLCQVVPGNFLARFFLSPNAATNTVDLGDTMQITFQLADYGGKKTEESTKLAGRSCRKVDRSFRVVRVDAAPTGLKESTHTQKICADDTITWRTALWQEVSKALLRQASAAELQKTLSSDFELTAGVPLSGTDEYSTLLGNGTKLVGKREWTTTAVEEVTIKPTVFALPEEYVLLSPSEIAAAIKKNSQDKNLVETLTGAIFCMLAGPIACLFR